MWFIIPIAGEVLVDEVPAQCKNYEGRGRTDRPIADLAWCVENSSAGLLIVDELTEELHERVFERATALSAKLGREIVFEIAGEECIAEMNAASLAARNAGGMATGIPEVRVASA